MNPEGQTDQERLGFLVSDVTRLLRQVFMQQLSADGESALTLAQLRALLQIARQEGMRQVELADRLDVQPITLARLIDSLQAKGLVERRADPMDRRAHRLFLTALAVPHLEASRSLGDVVQNQALQGLSVDEARQLFAALVHVRGNLAQMRSKPEKN